MLEYNPKFHSESFNLDSFCFLNLSFLLTPMDTDYFWQIFQAFLEYNPKFLSKSEITLLEVTTTNYIFWLESFCFFLKSFLPSIPLRWTLTVFGKLVRLASALCGVQCFSVSNFEVWSALILLLEPYHVDRPTVSTGRKSECSL